MADDRDGNRGRGSSRRSDSIFSDDDDRQERGRGSEGGFFQRAGEEVKSWFSDEDDRGSSRGQGSRSDYGAYERGSTDEPWGGGSGWSGGRGSSAGSGQRGGSSTFDDHYMSWRERQISQLDRDYEEYCRDRQQQFESEFHSWRQQRQSQSGSRDESAAGTAGEVTSGRTGIEGQRAGSGSTTRMSDDQETSAATTAGGGGELSATESSTGSSATTGSGARTSRKSQDTK